MDNDLEEIRYFSEHDTVECSDVSNLVSAYFDGDLCAEDREMIEEHASECKRCADLLADYKLLLDTAKDLAERKIPPKAHQRLKNALFERVGFGQREEK